jgi:hypothetical protein
MKFCRPTEKPNGNLVRTSACGRFSIERIEFQLPFASVEYRLTDTKSGETYENDTLRDARDLAQDIVDNPQDY